MDNFNIHKFFKDQYLTEAEAIPTSPGEMEKGDDGKMYNVKASNSERKQAMNSVINILRNELDVNQDDAFDYIRTHREDLFDGSVDAEGGEEEAPMRKVIEKPQWFIGQQRVIDHHC